MGVEMRQVSVGMERSSSLISAWQTMTHRTPSSMAYFTMSGWSPQMTMLSLLENSRFFREVGRAMVTSPEMESTV